MTDDRIVRRRRTIFLILFVTATVICWRRLDDIKAFLGPYFEAVDHRDPVAYLWACVGFTLAYMVACICLVPTTFLAPGLGFALGAAGGTVVATLGAMLGAGANYAIAHFLGRHWFNDHVKQNHRFRAVEIACRTRGFQIVLLTRLTPVFPSNIMSYFFGITNVKYGRFLLATAIGMLPRILVYTTIGDAAKSLAESTDVPLHEQPLLLYSIVGITIVVFVLLARIAERSLKQALDAIEATLPTESSTPVEESGTAAPQPVVAAPLTDAES